MCQKLPDIEACIATLMDGEQIKVWSYIMTIFGDMASQDGCDDSASGLRGRLLSRLTERIGIKPEAMRVALHRLRKDQWILAHKDGRTSRYRLSPDRLAETRAAAARIYALSVTAPHQWTLTIANPAEPLPLVNGDFIAISPQIVLGADTAHSVKDPVIVTISHDDLPGWARTIALPHPIGAEYATLAALFAQVNAALDTLPLPGAIDATTLRLLVVHRWRRLILRHSALAEQVQTQNWQGHTTRTEVSTLLARLPRRRAEELL